MVEEETKAPRDQEAVVTLTASQSVREPGRAFPSPRSTVAHLVFIPPPPMGPTCQSEIGAPTRERTALLAMRWEESAGAKNAVALPRGLGWAATEEPVCPDIEAL